MVTIEKPKDFFHNKSIYTGIFIVSTYGVVIVALLYVLFIPREYEIIIIEGIEVIRQKPLFDETQLMWFGIIALIYVLFLFGLMQMNAKYVMKEYSHMPVIHGPMAMPGDKGEKLDLWVEQPIPFNLLSDLEKREIVNYVIESKSRLREFDKTKQLEELIKGALERDNKSLEDYKKLMEGMFIKDNKLLVDEIDDVIDDDGDADIDFDNLNGIDEDE